MRVGILYACAARPGGGEARGETASPWPRGPAEAAEALVPLTRLGHRLTACVDAGAAELGAYAALAACDLVVNLVGGGAPAAVAAWAAAVAERLDVPCLGSPAETHLVCGDRPSWRAMCRGRGVPVTAGFTLETPELLGRRPVRFPVEVYGRSAAAREGRIAWNRSDLAAALREAAGDPGAPLTVASVVAGRRFTVALLGERILPPLERLPALAGSARAEERVGAARVPAALAGALGLSALRAASVLKMRDFAVLRFVWDGRGPPRLEEPDPRPSLLPGGEVAAAAAGAGMDPEQMWAVLLARFGPR